MTLFKNSQPIARIEGYASIYNIPDLNGDIVDSKAFEKKYQKIYPPPPNCGVMMLYQHKVDCPIGRWVGITSDKKGLYVMGDLLLDSPRAREVYALLKGNALNGLSIGFRTVKSEKLNKSKRIIKEADLWEISIVSFPMATQARITFVGDAEIAEPENPVRAGVCTQPARRASFPPSGARHFSQTSQFSRILRGAAHILSSH